MRRLLNLALAAAIAFGQIVPAWAQNATPYIFQQKIDEIPWINRQKLVGGAQFQYLFSYQRQILSGMGTWQAGVFTPNIPPGTITQQMLQPGVGGSTSASALTSGTLSPSLLPALGGAGSDCSASAAGGPIVCTKVGGQTPASVAFSGSASDVSVPAFQSAPTNLVGWLQGICATWDASGCKPSAAFVSAIPFSTSSETTARNLQDRFADRVNVLGFGADPTGVLDSTSAFNAAFATGREVYANNGGTYIFRSTLNVPTGARFNGGGYGTVLRQANGANLGALISTATNASNITLSNFTLDGNSANNTTAATEGLLVNGGNTIDVGTIRAYDCRGDNIAATGSFQRLKLHDLTSSGAGKACITVYSGTYYEDTNNITFDCGTHNNGIQGAVQNFLISGNEGYNTNTNAIADIFTGYNKANYNGTISNNIAVGGGNNGIHFGGDKISYIGNQVLSPAANGVLHTSRSVYATGTASVGTGSQTVTGTGTSWLGLCSVFSPTTSLLTIGGSTVQIQSISANGTLTLASPGWSGGPQINAPYSIACYVGSSDITVTGNTVTGVTGSNSDIYLDQVNGCTVDNESNDPSGNAGFQGYGLSNCSIKGNYSNKTNAGVAIYPEAFTTAGTVSVMNNSPTVTGTGTSFLSSIANGNVFRVNGDTVNYTVQSVNSDTSLTLASNYAGGNNPSAGYTFAWGLSTNLDINVTANGNGSGAKLHSLTNSRIGGVFNGNTAYGYQEAGASLNNTIFLAANNNGLGPVFLLAGAQGLYTQNGSVILIANGSVRTTFGPTTTQSSNNIYGSAATSFALTVNGATATAPTLIPNRADGKAGIGANVAGSTSLLANVGGNSTEIARGDLSGLFMLKSYPVASLPTCAAATRGMFATVTDASSPAYGAAPVGGGNVNTLVQCDAAWTVH